MKEKLKKFIEENSIEWHRSGEDIYLMPYLFQLQNLCDILGKFAFDEEGIECTLKSNYLVIPMYYVLNNYGIELDEIFCKENWDD